MYVYPSAYARFAKGLGYDYTPLCVGESSVIEGRESAVAKSLPAVLAERYTVGRSARTQKINMRGVFLVSCLSRSTGLE